MPALTGWSICVELVSCGDCIVNCCDGYGTGLDCCCNDGCDTGVDCCCNDGCDTGVNCCNDGSVCGGFSGKSIEFCEDDVMNSSSDVNSNKSSIMDDSDSW